MARKAGKTGKGKKGNGKEKGAKGRGKAEEIDSNAQLKQGHQLAKADTSPAGR